MNLDGGVHPCLHCLDSGGASSGGESGDGGGGDDGDGDGEGANASFAPPKATAPESPKRPSDGSASRAAVRVALHLNVAR